MLGLAPRRARPIHACSATPPPLNLIRTPTTNRMFPFYQPLPAPPAFGQGKILPESRASPFSRLVFIWLMPFLDVGFSRPLQIDDLWEFPSNLQASTIVDKLEANFFLQFPTEHRHPLHSDSKYTSRPQSPGDGIKDDLENSPDDSSPEQKPRQQPAQGSPLTKALHQTFFYRWWFAGVLKLGSDTLRATTPLVAKAFLAWLVNVYAYQHFDSSGNSTSPPDKPQGVGYGIGLALALFAMQEAASLMMSHYLHLATTTGLFARTGVTGMIIRKSLRLSRRARLDHNAGQIMNLISTDTARIDWFAEIGHAIWTTPIQVTIGTALLIRNLGLSALVGLGVLLLGFPLQLILVKVMYTQRKRCAHVTDSRLQLTSEVLQGIRLIKYYAWEQFYLSKVSRLRTKEIHAIKAMAVARSALIALVTFIPVLASISSFITYAATGNDLNVPVIFSSLQLFNVIRAPLSFLPTVLSSLSDVVVALRRISDFLSAEELVESLLIDHEAKNGVEAEGTFTWEAIKDIQEAPRKPKPSRRRWWKYFPKRKEVDELPLLPVRAAEDKEANDDHESNPEGEAPFELTDIAFRVPKGSFVAVVGRVGSGKSSLLQALIGEMRRTGGQVTFGGTVAYVPQSPWIRNATVRENIVFGSEEDEERFQQVVKACCLEHDFQMLPNGEETEIGEKGINLSGGQQARVSLARAAYSKSDVVLLDDSLSALDAHVGQLIIKNCILAGPLAGRTRILVTHALHLLDKTDHIYVMDNGEIVEHGTYDELMRGSVVFAHLIDEYGSHEEVESKVTRKNTRKPTRKPTMHPNSADHPDRQKLRSALIQSEERVTGSVPWVTYAKYFRFAGSILWVPAIIALALLSQAASVGNNLFLGLWTSHSIRGFSEGNYMAVYAALGVVQASFAFILTFTLAFAGLTASLAMFNTSFRAVLHSPQSFFDTNPNGRILSRLSKDQDILDTELTSVMSQFLYSFGSVLGIVALVLYTFPLLGLIFIPMALLYFTISGYYRRSSVETQRLDSILRSSLYGGYSETLTGLPTIRAYGEQNRTITNIENRLDLENKATYMTISIQRWLSARLDLSGNTLILAIALFSVGFRASHDPSEVGVLLSYTLSITQLFSDMVSQYAKNEQNMNSVERVLLYTALPAEGDTLTPQDPPASWPEKGAIRFSNVELAYREGLPLVLKGVSFEINAGEKIGIVGRTGAGKSSLLQALFRMANLQGGEIVIDGYNTRTIGLNALRSSLALVPQDTTLFSGSLRDNLDPQRTRTDAELISILQRVDITTTDGIADPVAEAKFGLDSVVNDEGSNYSAGERQLLALCRALVKRSRIIVLDEATSSVDVETDQKVQKTIQTEFASSTLLCIAHRLNTVACCDRVLVMKSGGIAEYDTVLTLFDRRGSIFRSLCDEASLSREDILRIRAEGVFSSH